MEKHEKTVKNRKIGRKRNKHMEIWKKHCLPLTRLSFLPQHLVEGLLNFRRRVRRSFWLGFAFQDPPGKTDQ